MHHEYIDWHMQMCSNNRHKSGAYVSEAREKEKDVSGFDWEGNKGRAWVNNSRIIVK